MSVFVKGYTTILFSMLAGAAVVHNIYKPDLTLPIRKADTTPATSKKAEVGASRSSENDVCG